MTIFDEISIIANQLANEGKTPSVALVKAKLSAPIPLPKIISVLKTWQHDPKFIRANKEKSVALIKQSDAQNNDVAILIEQAVAPIKQELIEVRKLLEQLIELERSKH
jgi:hypothetical protein